MGFEPQRTQAAVRGWPGKLMRRIACGDERMVTVTIAKSASKDDGCHLDDPTYLSNVQSARRIRRRAVTATQFWGDISVSFARYVPGLT